MRVLIIEDERKAANELRQLMLELKPDWNVVDIIPSVADAIAWLTENRMPDLIFSDIQLADAVCFRIFEKIKLDCPIIFCTAYDQYAMKAFETNGIDYLLKPLNKTKLGQSLARLDKMKAMFGNRQGDIYAELGNIIGKLSVPAGKTLLVNHKEKIIPVKYDNVACFSYSQGVVTIRLSNNSAYHISMTIDEIEEGADRRQFYRANRQFLINRNAIQNIERFFARKLVVRLNITVPEVIIVSKAKAGDFLNWLEGSGQT